MLRSVPSAFTVCNAFVSSTDPALSMPRRRRRRWPVHPLSMVSSPTFIGGVVRYLDISRASFADIYVDHEFDPCSSGQQYRTSIAAAFLFSRRPATLLRRPDPSSSSTRTSRQERRLLLALLAIPGPDDDHRQPHLAITSLAGDLPLVETSLTLLTCLTLWISAIFRRQIFVITSLIPPFAQAWQAWVVVNGRG